MKIIYPNRFVEMKSGNINTGHDFELVKGQSRLDVIKVFFSQRTLNEYRINCQSVIVCILVVLICL